MASEKSRGIAASIWTRPEFSDRVMDAAFAEAIAEELDKVRNQALRLCPHGNVHERGMGSCEDCEAADIPRR